VSQTTLRKGSRGTLSDSFQEPEGLNCDFGTADGPCMNFTQLWLPVPWYEALTVHTSLQVPGALSMDDAIRQAIADLSALIDGADRGYAERIREMIRRLQDFDAQARRSRERTDRPRTKFPR
jgi:hypothetical protein